MASSKKPPRGELPERLEHFLATCVRPGQTLLLGLSGGLDSCVLLHLLARCRAVLGFELRALHVNHGISPNAPAWEDFCAERCRAAGVPFAAARVQVPRDGGLGLEAAARQLRYAALLGAGADAVVLAHHRDDQAETLLLQLLRGAGAAGLAAMPALRECTPGGPLLLRPLLEVPRTALLDYARQHALQWIEDESNLDLAYDRNYLRHAVMPALQARFPGASATLARSAGHLAEAAVLLRELAQQDAAQLTDAAGLDVDGLRRLSRPRAANLLRHWLEGQGVLLPTRRLQEALRQLCDARADAQLRIGMPGGSLHRYRGRALYVAVSTPLPDAGLAWHGESELRLPAGRLLFRQVQGQGLALARVHAAALRIQPRKGGERFRPDGRRPTRTLRHLLQEAGVPPWERAALPLLYLNAVLAVVPGVGVACELQAGAGEAGLVIEWRRA